MFYKETLNPNLIVKKKTWFVFVIIHCFRITALYNEKVGANERKRKRRTTIRYTFEILRVSGEENDILQME